MPKPKRIAKPKLPDTQQASVQPLQTVTPLGIPQSVDVVSPSSSTVDGLDFGDSPDASITSGGLDQLAEGVLISEAASSSAINSSDEGGDSGVSDSPVGATTQDDNYLTWVALDDPDTCDNCDELDQQHFTEETVPGWPGDGSFGQAVLCLGGPFCRCSLQWKNEQGDPEAGVNTLRSFALQSVAAFRQELPFLSKTSRR